MTRQDDIVYITGHARSIMTKLLWPDGPTCPDCGHHVFTRMKDGRYRCKKCGRKYSIRTGTIFEKSHLPMSKWLIALYLMLINNGLSSPALARFIRVTQPTAYYMMMKLRFLFDQSETKLSGDEIAIDEEYVGGSWSKFSLSKKQALLSKYMLPTNPRTVKEKMAIGNKVNRLYKQPVLGINDGNKIILQIMPRTFKQADVVEIYKKHVDPGSHAVSDCSRLYDDWKILTGSDISNNNHSKLQFKAPDGKSSNKIEGTFSQWKRQTLNLFCSISSRRLQLYLNEHSFRFNTRKTPIFEKLLTALKNARQHVSVATVREYDALNGRKNDPPIFNPYEMFKKLGWLINEIVEDGIVYRRADFVGR